MNSDEFCYWLQGYFEISKNVSSLDAAQLKVIKKHLALVFHNVTGTQEIESEEELLCSSEEDLKQLDCLEDESGDEELDKLLSEIEVDRPVISDDKTCADLEETPSKEQIKEIVKKSKKNFRTGVKRTRMFGRSCSRHRRVC